MKSLVLIVMSVFTLHMTAQTQSINSKAVSHLNQINLETPMNNEVFKSSMINAQYLKNNASSTSSIITKFETFVANFDITTLKDYKTNEPAEYKVVFKNKQGTLYVTYNQEGKIVSSLETYKNIAIPMELRLRIAKDYPNYSFYKTMCKKQYSADGSVNITYKVELHDGVDSTIINIDNGNLIE